METINRYIHINDWITIVCLFAFTLLALAKGVSHYHFRNFLTLIISDKYIKTHKEDTSKKRLHYTLIVFQGIITPLIWHNFIVKLSSINAFNLLDYIKLISFYIFFYGIKFLLEKSIGFLFDLKKKTSNYIFEKQSYFNYTALCLFIVLLGVIYSGTTNRIVTYIFLSIYLFSLITSVILAVANHRNLFYNKPYYFILYLCSFEIAPYILIFFIITKAI